MIANYWSIPKVQQSAQMAKDARAWIVHKIYNYQKLKKNANKKQQ